MRYINVITVFITVNFALCTVTHFCPVILLFTALSVVLFFIFKNIYILCIYTFTVHFRKFCMLVMRQ